MPTVSTKNDFGTGTSPILVDGIVVMQRDELKDPKILRTHKITEHQTSCYQTKGAEKICQ